MAGGAVVKSSFFKVYPRAWRFSTFAFTLALKDEVFCFLMIKQEPNFSKERLTQPQRATYGQTKRLKALVGVVPLASCSMI
jgi:hypothetical protein